MIRRAEIAARVFNTPLMVHAGKAQAILAALGGRIVDGDLAIDGGPPAIQHVAFQNGRPSAGKIGKPLDRAYAGAGVLPLSVVDNVAVIPVEGTLVHKGAFVGMSSGRTSYQGLQAQIAAALASPAIKGAVFEVDSFGGEVAGAFQTAEMISRLSAAKPTLAILTDNALSAGYLMAVGARQIVAPEEGRAGSIGVITMHVDYSKQLEQDGVKVTLIHAGKHKADGNPFAPLPGALASRIQAEVDAARQRFADAVGAARGARFTSAAAMATEAEDYTGAEALRLGLIDAIGDTHQAFDAFVAAVNSRR